MTGSLCLVQFVECIQVQGVRVAKESGLISNSLVA